MKGTTHLIVATFVFMLLEAYIPDVKLGDLAIVILFTLMPDIDLKFNSHRNVLFHSILIPCITIFGGFGILEMMLILSVGIHLLCDVRLPYLEKDEETKKLEWNTPGGFYLIKVGRKRLSFNLTNAWLILNGLIAIGLFTTYIILI